MLGLLFGVFALAWIAWVAAQASPGALPAARPLRVRSLVLLSPLVALASALVGSARAAPNEARIRLDDAACYLWGCTQWNRYCPA